MNMYMCTQSCPSLCDPMECSPPRLLCPWNFPGKNIGVVAIPFSRGSSQPRDQTHVSCVSCTGRQILYQLSQRRSRRCSSTGCTARGRDSAGFPFGLSWVRWSRGILIRVSKGRPGMGTETVLLDLLSEGKHFLPCL